MNTDRLTFNEEAKDSRSLQLLEFAGKIVGKCLYDSVVYAPTMINARFTSSFYKLILDLPLHYNDLETDDPELYNSKIKFILEQDMDDPTIREALGDLTFVEEEYVKEITPKG